MHSRVQGRSLVFELAISLSCCNGSETMQGVCSYLHTEAPDSDSPSEGRETSSASVKHEFETYVSCRESSGPTNIAPITFRYSAHQQLINAGVHFSRIKVWMIHPFFHEILNSSIDQSEIVHNTPLFSKETKSSCCKIPSCMYKI